MDAILKSECKKKKFQSRRNLVWLENGYVIKRILPDKDKQNTIMLAEFEANILSLLYTAGVAVPKLISLEYDTLTMEYIDGITLTDAILVYEQNNLPADKLVTPVIRWLKSFYEALPKGSIRGDVNCRNFILTQSGQAVGVDFESIPVGNKETDIGRLAAFILTYEPPNTTYKEFLVNMMLDEATIHLDTNHTLIKQAQEKELEEINKRRKLLTKK